MGPVVLLGGVGLYGASTLPSRVGGVGLGVGFLVELSCDGGRASFLVHPFRRTRRQGSKDSLLGESGS
eukprot:662196-Pyramimonas_sp.AAC.1